jgi:putative transposase
MSTPGQPTENAYAESFIKTRKWEEVYLHQYHTFEQAQARLQTFLEDVYNAKRLHSSLDDVPPDEVELKYSMCSCLVGLDFLGALRSVLLSLLLSEKIFSYETITAMIAYSEIRVSL